MRHPKGGFILIQTAPKEKAGLGCVTARRSRQTPLAEGQARP